MIRRAPLTLALTAATLFLLCPVVVRSQPVVELDKTSHRFKPVFRGERLEHTFIVKNGGDKPLLVRSVKPS